VPIGPTPSSLSLAQARRRGGEVCLWKLIEFGWNVFMFELNLLNLDAI
jgi:hypothetical protein